ncbi:MAG: DUF4136 domain-containing protein [Pseudomonadota bacterium]|nr:DUF4136 domain-containing protein [Pseudomonadota bacterium]
MKRALAAVFSVVLMAFFIAGCAATRLVESDVSAFYRWSGAPPAPGTLYRFERLPSQQAAGLQQDHVEDLTRSALARVGLVLNPATARFSVQVRVSTQMIERGFYGSPGFHGFGGAGVFLGGGSRGASVGLSLPMHFSEPPYYRRELTLLMRDLGTGQVVFETSALSDSVQNDTLAVLPAMLEAALRGFPQPPAGTRRIPVEIPRQTPARP